MYSLAGTHLCVVKLFPHIGFLLHQLHFTLSCFLGLRVHLSGLLVAIIVIIIFWDYISFNILWISCLRHQNISCDLRSPQTLRAACANVAPENLPETFQIFLAPAAPEIFPAGDTPKNVPIFSL